MDRHTRLVNGVIVLLFLFLPPAFADRMKNKDTIRLIIQLPSLISVIAYPSVVVVIVYITQLLLVGTIPAEK